MSKKKLTKEIEVIEDKLRRLKEKLKKAFSKIKIDADTKLSTGVTLKELNRTIKKKMEKEVITKTLNEANWNKAEVARRLGIDYKTLYYKIKNYGIKKSKVRTE